MDVAEGERLQREINSTDLGVSITTTAKTAAPRDLIVYVVVVTNSGPNPASQPRLIATLSEGLSHVEDDGGCVLEGPRLVCNLSEIEARQSKEIRITGEVRPQATDPIVALIELDNLAGPDAEPGNNAARSVVQLDN